VAIGRAAARLAVDVNVDTKAAASQLGLFDKRLYSSAARAAAVAKSYDEVGASSKAMGKQVADTDVHVRKSSDGFRGFSKNVITASATIHVLTKAMTLLKWPAYIAAAGAAAEAIAALAGGAVALTAALGPLSGALASAGSGLVLFGQVRATLALARIKDVTAAVGGLNERLDKSADAFKKLSPEGQKFAITLDRMKKPVKELQAAVQAPLFSGLTAGLKEARSAFPTFQKILRGTAKQLGDIATRMGVFVGSKDFASDIARIGKTNNQALGRLGGVLLNLSKAFTDVLVVARPLTLWFTKLFARWSDGIKAAAALNRRNGDLAKFFEQTKDVTQDLVGLFKNLWGALYNIGKLGAPLGRQIIDKLVEGSRALKEWTESARGKNSIAEFFKQIRPPLWEAGRLLVDVVKAFFSLQSRTQGVLTPMLKQLRTQLLPVLTDLITSTTKAFGPRLIDLITNVAKVIGHLAGTSGPLNVWVDTMNALAKALNWMIEHVPGFQTVLVTLIGYKAISSAFNFGAAITGIKTFVTHLGILGGVAKSTAATVSAAEATMAASGQMQLFSTAAMGTGESMGASLIAGFKKFALKAGPWAVAAGGVANIAADAIGGDMRGAAFEAGGGAAGALAGGLIGGLPGALIGGGIGTVLGDALGDALKQPNVEQQLAEKSKKAIENFQNLIPALSSSSRRVQRARQQDTAATRKLSNAEERLMRAREKYPDNSREVVRAEDAVRRAKLDSRVAGTRLAASEQTNTLIRGTSKKATEEAVKTTAAHVLVLKEEAKGLRQRYIELAKSDAPIEEQVEALDAWKAKQKEIATANAELKATIRSARQEIGPKFAASLKDTAFQMGRIEKQITETDNASKGSIILGGPMAGGIAASHDALSNLADDLQRMARNGRAIPRNLIKAAGLDPADLKASGARIVDINQNLNQLGKKGAGKLFGLLDRMKQESGSVAVGFANMSKKQREAFKDAAKQALKSGAITENEYDRLIDKFRKAGEVQEQSWKRAARATGESTRDIKKNVGDMTVKVSKSYDGMVTASIGGMDWLMSKTGAAMKALGLKQELKWKRTRGGLPTSQAGHPQRTGGITSNLVPGIGTGDKVPLHLAGHHVADVEPGELVSVTNRRATARLMEANDAIPRDGAALASLGGFRKGGSLEAAGGMSAMIALANKYERAHYPYQWGGGHGGFPNGTQPVDCSGAVSDILHAGGLLDGAPMVSGALMSWGQPAKGNEAVVVYANPDHTVMSLNGKVFGTSNSNQPGGGAGWIEGASGASLAPGAKRTMPVSGGAMVKEIARQILHQKGGREAAMHDEGQGAMDKTWRSANAFLAKLMPKGAFGGGDSQLPFSGTYTASWYGPTPSTTGAAGVDLRGTQSFAELSNDPGAGTGADFAALGGLPFHTHISVTYRGRTIDVEKLDVGAGGPGLNGHIRAIDLWEDAAKRLPGFMAAGIADVDIGMAGGRGKRRGKRKGGLLGGLRTGSLVGPQLDKLTMERGGGDGHAFMGFRQDQKISQHEQGKLLHIAGKGRPWSSFKHFKAGVNAALKAEEGDIPQYRKLYKRARFMHKFPLGHLPSYNVRKGGVLGLQDGGVIPLTAAAGELARPSVLPSNPGWMGDDDGGGRGGGRGSRGGKILNLSKTIKRLVGLDDSKKHTVAEKQKKIVEGVRDRLKKLVKGKDFPVDANGELAGTIGELREQANTYGEWADNAASLEGPFKQKTETEWLQKELTTLLRLRNVLIKAIKQMEEREDDITDLERTATKRLHNYEKKVKRGEKHLGKKGKTPSGWDDKDENPQTIDVAKWNKLSAKKRKNLLAKFDHMGGALPGDRYALPNGKLATPESDPKFFPNIEGWKRVTSLLQGTVLGALKGSGGIEATFKDTIDTLREELKTVAGTGGGMQILKPKDVIDKVGRFGGEILDIQTTLRDIAAENAPQAMSIDDLRGVIEAARFGVFDDLPKFHTGGVVPGPVGQEVPIMARGGEVVSTGAGDVTVVNNFSWDEFGAVIETEVNGQFAKRERIERHARRQF